MSPNARYRNFSDSLALIRDGATDDEAGRLLNQAISAVEATGKPAELTLKLKISLAAKNSEMVKIDPIVDAKLPKHDVAPSIFFIDDDKNLAIDKPGTKKRGPTEVVAPSPIKREAVG